MVTIGLMMTEAQRTDLTMDWKQFSIRLIEALRWPAAFALIVWLLREPIGVVMHAMAQGIVS